MSNLKVDSIKNAAGDGATSFPEGLLLPNANKGGNILDWAQRGLWTPAISAATPGTLSVTHSTQYGRFTRIMDVVMVNFRVGLSAFTLGTASGDLLITGLPFPALVHADHLPVGALYLSGTGLNVTTATGTSIGVVGVIFNGESSIRVRVNIDNSGPEAVSISTLTSTPFITGNFMYHA